MDKKYILFDLDGTLTDPKTGITRSVAYALSRFGIKVADTDTLVSFIGPPLISSFMDRYGFRREKAEKAVEAYREYFSDKGIFENSVIEGVPQMLESLKNAGKTLVLATSKPEQYAVQIIEHFGLNRYFSHICGSRMDNTRSAKCEVIEYALEKAGVPDKSQAVMVGDRRHDIEGALACGIEPVGVLFGYGSAQELESAGAGYIVSTVNELTSLLKGESCMDIESSVIFFPCIDIVETKEYYTKTVGLKIYKDLGDCVWFDCGRGYLGFCYYGPDRPMAAGQCISFNLASCREVDLKYEELRLKKALGIKDPPQRHPRFPVYSFFFTDPNGYTLEFQKTLD